MSSSAAVPMPWPYGPVVFGCGSFGGIGGNLDFLGKGMDEASSFAAMDEAASLGIELFDTAERYAAGESERIIGSWLASRPTAVTEPVRISTKVGPPWLDRGDGRFDLDYIETIFSGSLERLGVEVVDILYTHAPDDHASRPPGYEPVPIEVTIEALEAIRATGRVRHIGASNIEAHQLTDAIEAADRMGVAGYEVIQNGFNLLDPTGDAAVRSMAREHGLAYTAYSALASGVLTGKYRRDAAPPHGSLVDLGYLDAVTPEVHDAIDQLRVVASERGTVPGVLALAWLMAHPDVAAFTTAPSRTPPHLSLFAEAADCSVTGADATRWSEWFAAAARPE